MDGLWNLSRNTSRTFDAISIHRANASVVTQPLQRRTVYSTKKGSFDDAQGALLLLLSLWQLGQAGVCSADNPFLQRILQS